MSKDDIRQIIEVQAEALGPLLHAGMANSLVSAADRNRGLQHAKYPHLLPLLMRAEMREFLESNLLPNDWDIGGDSRRMGQLLLSHSDLNLEMQFLKERRRTYPGGVPIAGRNTARRERWVDVPLDLALPAGETNGKVDPVRLLLLWDFADAKNHDTFTLRVVHTIGAGVHGQPVPCDLVLDVTFGGEIFKRLAFPSSPEDDHDFFVVEVDEREDESGFSG